MSRRRRSNNAAFSLFSFQDIISSVMGIMVLIVLIVAIELSARRMESPAVQRQTVQQDLTEQISLISTRVETLKQLLSQSGGVVVAPLTKGEIEAELKSLEEVTAALTKKQLAAEELAKKLQDAAATEKLRAEASPAKEVIEKQQSELAAAEAELQRIKLSKTLIFRKQPGETKQAWIVEIEEGQISCAAAGRREAPRQFRGGSTVIKSEFLSWARSKDRSSDYFVLMSKPSGAVILREVEETLRDRGFSVGMDLLGEDQAAIDPVHGVPTVDPDEGK